MTDFCEKRAGEAAPELIDWILRFATARDSLGDLLTVVCERLVSLGVPLCRASLDLPTIDPNARAVMHKWWRDRAGASATLSHGPEQAEEFQRSVIYHLISRGLDGFRWKLERGEGTSDFSLLDGLREEGCTDYLMHLVRFGEDETLMRGVAISIATDRPGGFADGEIAAVTGLFPALGLAAYRVSAAHTAENALSVYLGPKTAGRVLAGAIQRGEGQRISAAIFIADLRGFTAVAEREDALRVVGWLNEHFEVIGDAVAARGGEILKFVGDGLLAVFPVDEADGRPCPGCEAALSAAEEAQAANDRLNERRLERGEPVLPVDIALHFGELVYGNVGARRRLDFTVIGRAVNEASRMEALCGDLRRSTILSEPFARRCSTTTVPLGAFALRGIEGTHLIYGVAKD